MTTTTKKNNKLGLALGILCDELKLDKEYRQVWVANIAMAYKDNEHWYKKETGKKFLSREDKHIIANEAAEYFIDMPCR